MTVLFLHPGRLLVLSFLWDFHLLRVPDQWLESVESSHLMLDVCALCVFCALLSIVFSCFVLAALTTRLTDSVDHPSAKNSIGPSKVGANCRAPQDKNRGLLSYLDRLLCLVVFY